MMRREWLIVVAIIFAAACSASAQFTISKVVPYTESLGNIRDSMMIIRPSQNYSNEFFNEAFWKAERKRIRKERNTVEFSPTLQIAQTQFENWASGGDNTFSGRSTIYYRHLYERKKLQIETKFDARYGLNYIEGKSFKNEDEFKASLLWSWNINKYWSYAASTNLRSQFSTSYKARDDDTRVSTLMAPGFYDVSVGFKYEKKIFSAIVSPVGGSAVFVLDEELRKEGMNGVPAGERSKWMVGPSVQLNLDMEFVKKVFRLRSNLYSFTNLKKPPTMRWETTLEIRATKFLTTTLYGLAYYDKEAETAKPDALQYKYSLSIGLQYTLKNKK